MCSSQKMSGRRALSDLLLLSQTCDLKTDYFIQTCTIRWIFKTRAATFCEPGVCLVLLLIQQHFWWLIINKSNREIAGPSSAKCRTVSQSLTVYSTEHQTLLSHLLQPIFYPCTENECVPSYVRKSKLLAKLTLLYSCI